MLKLIVAVVVVALASTASAAGWRSLRMDASSEARFRASVVAFQQKLPAAHRYVFAQSLQDIWLQATKSAKAEQREYTASDYRRQLDGLGYKEIAEFTDPTGATADRYRDEYDARYAAPMSPGSPPPPTSPAANAVRAESQLWCLLENAGSSAGQPSGSRYACPDAGQAPRAEGRIGGNRR